MDLIKQIGNTGAAMNGAVIKEKIVPVLAQYETMRGYLGRRIVCGLAKDNWIILYPCGPYTKFLDFILNVMLFWIITKLIVKHTKDALLIVL